MQSYEMLTTANEMLTNTGVLTIRTTPQTESYYTFLRQLLYTVCLEDLLPYKDITKAIKNAEEEDEEEEER